MPGIQSVLLYPLTCPICSLATLLSSSSLQRALGSSREHLHVTAECFALLSPLCTGCRFPSQSDFCPVACSSRRPFPDAPLLSVPFCLPLKQCTAHPLIIKSSIGSFGNFSCVLWLGQTKCLLLTLVQPNAAAILYFTKTGVMPVSKILFYLSI